MNPALASAAVFVFGLVVGSFLNAVIHRLPRGIGLSFPRRSFCPSCGRSLPWHENIPVLSWVLLRGRCSSCGAKISFRYPLVELLTAVVFVLIWRGFEPPVAAAYMIFAAILIAGTFIDLEHMILPDSLTVGGAVAGVVLSMVVPGLQPGALEWDERLRASIFGAAVGFAVLLAVVELGKLAFGRKRVALEPAEPFEISFNKGAPRLVFGAEEWELEEFFYRPTDVLEIHLQGGEVWHLGVRGVRRGGALADYASAHGWKGAAEAVVVPREAMGFGDVKFMLTLGAFLGWPGALFSIGAGSVIGAFAGVLLLAAGRLGEAGRIPFGPYLAAGALLWIAAGPDLVRWCFLR
ncbi:MAG: prepilin peptidase [Chthoniobacterales bacterium]|nr:prepilin peptidase [Chthoniobacterales bacterium]